MNTQGTADKGQGTSGADGAGRPVKVVAARSAGFCFGVRRAVLLCEKAAKDHPGCVMLGPVIHNEHVISKLESIGIRLISRVSEVPSGGTVIIRSHGEGKAVYDELEEMGVHIIDATCPDVKKIHSIAGEETRAGRVAVIIGQRMHPEVAAISGWCDRSEVFETADELSRWLSSGDNAQKPLSFVFQTTKIRAVYESCVELIKKVCTNHRIFDTICDTTCKRQMEAAQISKTADIMVVVGGRNSANTLRLAEICEENCSRVIFAESADDLTCVNLSGTVGITAGASTPSWIIKEVINKMSEEIKLDDTTMYQEARESLAASEDGIQDEDTSTLEEPPIIQDANRQMPEAANPEPPVQETADTETTAPEAGYGQSQENEVQADVPAVPEEGEAEVSAASETFEEMLEKSIKTLHTGEKVSGVVTSITATEVSVDLGTKQSGYIPIGEFTDETNADIDDIIKVGDTIETFVMRVNDVEGMVMLSKKRLDAIKNWNDIEAARESRTIVEGIVTEENKGGIVVNVKGVRVFIPASQTGLPKSSPMTELVRKTVKLRITEVNQSRRRVVGSIRAVQNEERREKSDRLWNEIEVGKVYSGVVKSMTSYGVFVDIGGVDGMIHISELSWTRVKQPSEVMSVGDEVTVHVLSFDKENRKISLGYKKNEDNPWTKFKSNNAVGDIVNVKIVKMMPFGAFAEICPGVDGLIHISQITDHRIGLPSEILSDGQMVDVKITEIDNERKKVSLSIRALIDTASQPLTEKELAMAARGDDAPTVVYDTDAPPESDEDFSISEGQSSLAPDDEEAAAEQVGAAEDPEAEGAEKEE